jgi:hypothetical protein
MHKRLSETVLKFKGVSIGTDLLFGEFQQSKRVTVDDAGGIHLESTPPTTKASAGKLRLLLVLGRCLYWIYGNMDVIRAR